MGWCSDTVFIIWTTTVVVGFQRASWNSHPTWWSPYPPRHPHSAQTWSIRGQTNFMCPACPQQKHTSFRVTIFSCTFFRRFFAGNVTISSSTPSQRISQTSETSAFTFGGIDGSGTALGGSGGSGTLSLGRVERHPLGTFEGLTKSPEIFTFFGLKKGRIIWTKASLIFQKTC